MAQVWVAVGVVNGGGQVELGHASELLKRQEKLATDEHGKRPIAPSDMTLLLRGTLGCFNGTPLEFQYSAGVQLNTSH
jgi:hypothetical protein